MACDDSTKILAVLVKLLMFVAVLQCIALMSTTIYWSEVRKSKLKVTEPELRIPMKHEQIPKELSKLSLQNNNTEFAGRGSDVLTALSNLAVSHQYDSDAVPETVDFDYGLAGDCRKETDQKPWIKLMDPQVVPVPDKNMSKIIWNLTEPMSEEKNSVLTHVSKDDSIVVGKDGIYYVTAQLVTDCPIDESGIDNPLKFSICLRSNESSDANCILTNARSKCDHIENDVNVISTSIGAVFKLSQDDRVFVATSKHEGFKLKEINNSYFAIYAV